MQLNQITLPSLNISQTREFYLRLGFTLIVDSPHYLRFYCDDGGTTFSFHYSNNDSIEKNNSVIYFECDQLDAQYRLLVDKQFNFLSEPTDQVWAWREARLLDPSGNEICLYHAADNRVNPPWRVTVKE